MALKANTKPSVTCSGHTSSILRGPSAASVTSIITTKATPPTSAAASPPRKAGRDGNSRGSTITPITARKASGVTTAKVLDQRTRRRSSSLTVGPLGKAGSAPMVPRASSALSNEPDCSIRARLPSWARACQASNNPALAGTMCLRISR
ncbi:hypothetical protein D3C73_1098880 [compost metagenome]